ncbi:mitogen-activated kinase kinase kinase 14 [Pelobates cultripes]|uniref:Mitogen-activated kinase kinase kinase 14 n=1 Tax=Pelobates cultripes TaxID=61616 RepID=A0AAD1WFG3_PELCU|nr:mitogen-activated kinase kinase kinase 14 [Pelobates cultripes]
MQKPQNLSSYIMQTVCRKRYCSLGNCIIVAGECWEDGGHPGRKGEQKELALGKSDHERKEGLSVGFSIIAQPECENNQEICPSSQKPQIYKQYSRSESFDHIPNNVAQSTESRLTPKASSTRGKGKKAKKKRGGKDGERKIERRRQCSPEEEMRAPIPVQDEETQSHARFTGLCKTDEKKHLDSIKQLNRTTTECPSQDFSSSKKDGMWMNTKLISPDQFLYHVGAGKLPPANVSQTLYSPDSKILGIIHDLGIDKLGHDYSLKSDSFKFEDPFVDSNNHSVEECNLEAVRGSVIKGKIELLEGLAKDWTKKKNDENDKDNEGILLTKDIKPVDYEYKENIHWKQCGEKLGSGSFGDVVPAKDESSGFLFAAKKISIDNFRAEEITCCLEVKSPRLLPMYGAVREGRWITVLMKIMKGGSLGQKIKKMGYLPEDLALYYLEQVLCGLEHLHAANIAHGDIKADNVLLSEDGKEACLCDFGKSSKFSPGILKKPLMTADYVPGTETHMAPEIVRGEPCDTKIDIWSIGCMMLHMMNGWHPWTRTHKPPLCLQIAKEPPPLQEIPTSCDPITHKVIVAALEKDPMQRMTATQLKEKVKHTLCKMGGLKSPGITEYKTPRIFPCSPTGSSKNLLPKPKLATQKSRIIPNSFKKELMGDTPFPYRGKNVDHEETSFELEIKELEKGLLMDSLCQTIHLRDPQQMLRSEKNLEPIHSLKNSCDTGSSGFDSWKSQMDTMSCNSGSILSGGNTITPSWFNGVKVNLQTLSGETLYILESGQKQLGDLAIGISSQIPVNAFTIVTTTGKPIPWDTQISECGTNLQCSLALDYSGGGWTWRVKQGELEKGPSG